MIRFEKVSYDQYCEAIGGDAELRGEYDDIILPQRATLCSAGYDFFAPFSFELSPGETIKIPTGIRVLLDYNKFLMCVPRSGLGFKYRLQLDNTVGIIDADYAAAQNEGHIFVKMTNDGREGKTISINKGTAMFQGIIQSYYVTDDDNPRSVERIGGFGSTDRA